MAFRSRTFTDVCRRIPCQALFAHNCTGRFVQDDGLYLCVPAHSNELLFGRGVGLKTDDCFVAAVCPPAHDLIDGRGGGWSKDVKRAEWLRAHIGTMRFAWCNGLFRLT